MSFKQLNAIDCTKHVEKKGKFTYLSWAWAWQTLKDHCPDATFRKHTFSARDNDGVQVPFMVDEAGYAYVMVTVTVDGLEATEIMPVLNHSNKPIQNPNSFDVNTALQRTLVKAIAFHGLGLYIYAGEDVNPVQEPEEPLMGMEELKVLCERKGSDWAKTEDWVKKKGSINGAVALLNERPDASEPALPKAEPEVKAKFDKIILESDALEMFVFQKLQTETTYTDLYHSFTKGNKGKYQRTIDDLVTRGKDAFEQYIVLTQDGHDTESEVSAEAWELIKAEVN
jgi:hypothetical protein